MIGRGGGHLAHLVAHQLVEALVGGLHRGPLLLQALVERLRELDRDEILEQRLGEDQRRGRREVAGARGALVAGAGVGVDDHPQLVRVARGVVARLEDLGDLVAGLHRHLDRAREVADVAAVHLQRLVLLLRLGVEVGGDLQRGTPDLVILRLGLDALVFGRRQRQLAGLLVDVRDLLGDFRLQLVARVGLAEGKQRLRGAVPVLELDQRGRAVVVRSRPDLRGRRRLADAQEVLRRHLVILGLVRLFTLLVDGGGEVLDQVGARFVVLRGQLEDVDVALLGVPELVQFVRGMRHHQPGRAAQRLLCVGERGKHLAAGGDRERVILHAVDVFQRGAHHQRGLLVLREGLGELERAADDVALDPGPLGLGGDIEVLAMGVDRRIAGRRCLLVRRIVVRGALVFHGGLAVPLVLQQQVGQLVVDRRGVFLFRERIEELAVPGERLLEVLGLVLHVLRILIQRVIVVRQLLQVGLQVADHVRIGIDVEMLPVRRLEAVVGHERLVGLNDQARESALLVDLDHPHVEVRRNLVVGVELDEGLVRRGRVGIAALLQVVLAEVAVDLDLKAALAVLLEVLGDRLRAAEVREAQADDAVGVLDALLLELVGLVLEVVALADLVIEQRDKAMQAVLVKLLLVEGPAELVEREFVVGGTLAHRDDALVGVLGVEVFLAHEEVFAAPELDFVGVSRARILPGHPVHHLHRLVDLAELLVGARHLVQDLVVTLIQRVFLEQLLVEDDRLGRVGVMQVGCALGRRHRLGGDRRLDLVGLRRALLEILRRLAAGIGDRARTGGTLLASCRLVAAPGVEPRRAVDPARGQHRRPAGAASRPLRDPVFLFDLEVGEAADRLGGHGGLRRLLEELLVARHRLFDAALDLRVLEVELDLPEVGNGALLHAGGTARQQEDGCRDRGKTEMHHFASGSLSCCCCALTARS